MNKCSNCSAVIDDGRRVCDSCKSATRAENRAAWRFRNREKIKAQSRANYLATKEKQLANQKARRASNPDLFKKRVKRWTDANVERMTFLRNRWKRENRERVCAYSQARRAAISKARGNVTEDDIKEIFSLQKGKCAICKSSVSESFHADHIMPLARGGDNDPHNIQLLCPRCNLKKGAKNPTKYMQSLGMLL